MARKDRNYETINGKRQLPYLLNPSIEPLYFGGVQSFNYAPTLEREAHGEFGAKGDVISLVDYKDVTGSIDTKDLGARDLVNLLLTGINPDGETEVKVVDWADVETVHLFTNMLNKERTHIQKSIFLYKADFQPDYQSELNGVLTAKYDFTAIRCVEFTNQEIVYKGFRI